MYDVEHMDQAIEEIHGLRQQTIALRKIIKDMGEKERMRNRRCALDVAGRVLNYNLGDPKTASIKGDEVASQVLLLADKLLAWLEPQLSTVVVVNDDMTEQEATELRERFSSQPAHYAATDPGIFIEEKDQ